MTPHEAAVLREQRDSDARVVAEIGPRGLRADIAFTDPYMTIKEFWETIAGMERRGYEFSPPMWHYDAKGNRDGLTVRELTGGIR